MSPRCSCYSIGSIEQVITDSNSESIKNTFGSPQVISFSKNKVQPKKILNRAFSTILFSKKVWWFNFLNKANINGRNLSTDFNGELNDEFNSLPLDKEVGQTEGPCIINDCSLHEDLFKKGKTSALKGHQLAAELMHAAPKSQDQFLSFKRI